MNEHEKLVADFENNRAILRGIAYRMLGSLSEADDAVQETWLHLCRSNSGPRDIHNLRGWLMTVVARVCLDMLRLREARREEPFDMHFPDLIVYPDDAADPEHQILAGEAVGLALLVVLETLAPAERIAFVLHDVFAIPYDEIARIVDRTPTATRQLASRARRRIQGTTPGFGFKENLDSQREAAKAFLAAANQGNFQGLLTVLDPEVILRADTGDKGSGPLKIVQGARNVASQALTFARLVQSARPVLVNGQAGLVATRHNQPYSVMAFTVKSGKIVEIYVLSDPDRLRQLNLNVD